MTTLRLGDIAPDFVQDSTAGNIHFHQWLGNQWGILFSHPKDFTPVCTTELGCVAKLSEEFKRRDVKVIAVSVDDKSAHDTWMEDINETQQTQVEFPILADPDRKIATLYDMIHTNADDALTVRSVFFIDPQKKIRAILIYPASAGRNFTEILRLLDSLQLSDSHHVVTPANWQPGEDVIVPPSVQDPTELKEKYPHHKTIKPYLRTVPDPKFSGSRPSAKK